MYACRFFDHSWHKEVVRGKWTEGRSGGCTNFKMFYLNPHYSIEVMDDHTKIFIMLAQEKNKLSDGIINNKNIMLFL